jgi:anti-sigma factor RsiW
VSGRDHGQCLKEDTLTDYLEGRLDPAVRAASEAHLVVCDNCRSHLGYFMRLLSDEVPVEEYTVLENLTDQSHRQRVSTTLRSSAALYKLLIAVAASVILIVSARFVLERSTEPKSAGEVVQLLLAQHRPFEARMSGEPHLPILRTRGADEPGASYSLLAAEMTRLSANSHEMGRFYLLQKDFKRAIPYLEMAEREVGASSAVHNDLGVAYLESENATLLSKAADEFQHALRTDSSFAPAVFNLAVFHERNGATAQAETQWKVYLGLDAQSEWAIEAQARLQGLSR